LTGKGLCSTSESTNTGREGITPSLGQEKKEDELREENVVREFKEVLHLVTSIVSRVTQETAAKEGGGPDEGLPTRRKAKREREKRKCGAVRRPGQSKGRERRPRRQK